MMADIIPFPIKARPSAAERADPRLGIFRAPTDSMAPTIAPGDIVEIDEACNVIRTDGLFVIDIDGSPAIRRVQRVPGTGRVRLSTDAAPTEAELVDRAAVRVLARVTRYWSERTA